MPQTSPTPGLFETIYTTRALRRFKPDPIPEEVLFQLFDAAIRAPSGQNVQDWRFVVITDPAVKREMQAWAEESWKRYQPQFAADPAAIDALPRTKRLSLRSVEHLSHHLAEVPAIILVCGLKGRHSTPGGSTFPAVQNLMLAARALGLGGSVFNLALRRDRLHEMLAIPENNEIYCLLPMGYPTDKQGPVRRKPVKDVVYLERFGAAWEFAAKQPENGWQDRWVARDTPLNGSATSP
ncbi:MAG: nitroreductase family protein [Chloroflexi bacterium]|nr:nitroreductase family protein [Chloroflexota bacterium]